MDPARLAEDHGKGEAGSMSELTTLDQETREALERYKQENPKRIKTEKDEQNKYMDLYGEIFFKRFGNFCRKHGQNILPKDERKYIEGRDKWSQFTWNEDGNLNGNIEIKTFRYLLTRDNDGDATTGTVSVGGSLPFEIFHNSSDNAYAGWLPSMYSPEQYNKIKEQHGREERATLEGVLAFVLWSESKQKPFATVVFENENVLELLKRLITLCPDADHPENWGLSFEDITRQIPCSTVRYWDQYRGRKNFDKVRGGLGIYDGRNTWYVPFDQLADLATVTIIGEQVNEQEEMKAHKNLCPAKIVHSRLYYLYHTAQREGQVRRLELPETYNKHMYGVDLWQLEGDWGKHKAYLEEVRAKHEQRE